MQRLGHNEIQDVEEFVSVRIPGTVEEVCVG